MTQRTHRHLLTLIACIALPTAGCDDSEAATTEPSAAESAPAETQAAPAPPSMPEGWEELEVQVQGNAVTVLVPSEEREVDAADWGTAIYGSLPGQSYPYYFSLKHHDEAPPLRMVLNKPGLEQQDTDFGFQAELREEDGNGWSYAVYNDSQKLSCSVSLSSSSGVSDALIEEARRPCARLAE